MNKRTPILGDIMRRMFGENPVHEKPVTNDKIRGYAKSLKTKKPEYLSKQQVIELYHKNCEQIEPDYSRKINAEYLDLLAGYMTCDDSFFKENKYQINGSSFNKNIMLIGIIGCGKSFLLRNISQIRNVENPIAGKFINEMELLENRETAFAYKNYKHLIIDDLGTNKDGLEARWMRQLAEVRHEKWLYYKYQTHFTTNLTPKKIEEIYGTRLKDRIYENCNIIVFKSEKSLRK